MKKPSNATPESMLIRNKEYLEEAEKLLAPYSEYLACGDRCSWCCYLHVTVKPYELFALQEILNGVDSETRNKIHTQAESNWNRVKTLSSEELLTINLPCPFLNQDSCGIYEVRPFSCRSAHSLRKSTCEQAFDTPEDLTIAATQLESRAKTSFSFEAGVEEMHWNEEFDVDNYSFNGVILNMLKGDEWQKKWCRKKDAFNEELRSKA